MMRKFWIIKAQASNPKVVEIDIYGDIEGDSYDWWWGEKIESETSAAHIKKELKSYKDIERVELHINSWGGSVFEANAIANMLRRLECDTVAYIDAFACSAASVVAVACKKVIMPRNAVLMIHNPWQVAVGNATELRKAADDLDTLSEAFRTIYLDKAGDKLTEQKLIEMLDAETYLTAEQAFEYGLCDEVEQFDAVLHEPDTNTTAAAAKQHVDLGKVCAMVRGEEKPELESEKEPEQEPEKQEPEAKEEAPIISDKSEPDTFEEDVKALIFKFIR